MFESNLGRPMNRALVTVLIGFSLFISGCYSPSPPDMDNDGIEDEEDDDIDGDEFNNTVELNCESDPRNNTSIPSDIDNDGLCNVLDLDMDCLLYTSPSPRDQRGSRMPSSA